MDNITKLHQTDRPTCSAPTKTGKPCRGRPGESGYCFAHDPAIKDKREAARVKGGENSSHAARLEKLLPSRLRSTFDRLETAIKEVHEGRLDPRRATAMASVAGAMVKIIKAGEEEASTDLAPQFIINNLDEWYAENRALRRVKPAMSWEESYEQDPEMAEWMKKYCRDEKFPKEVL
ncbi:MAG: hypothetical protein IH822_08125 [Chloroflexi bacterium]|nr:hypothetical protein [Chloroflexota bacterium]